LVLGIWTLGVWGQSPQSLQMVLNAHEKPSGVPNPGEVLGLGGVAARENAALPANAPERAWSASGERSDGAVPMPGGGDHREGPVGASPVRLPAVGRPATNTASVLGAEAADLQAVWLRFRSDRRDRSDAWRLAAERERPAEEGGKSKGIDPSARSWRTRARAGVGGSLTTAPGCCAAVRSTTTIPTSAPPTATTTTRRTATTTTGFG